MDQNPAYKLLGNPRLSRSRGKPGETYVQRYRLLDEPTRKVRVVSLRTRDKGVARRVVVKFVEDAIRDIRNPPNRHAKKTFFEHLTDYTADLTAEGRDDKYIQNIESRIRRLGEGCGFQRVEDLEAPTIRSWLCEQRNSGEFGMQTSVHFVASVKQFSSWLVRHDRLQRDLLATLKKKPNGDVPVDRPRPIFKPAEFTRLLQNAINAPERRRLSGRARAILYVTASQTGFRAQELASITPNCCFVNDDQPFIRIDCRISKRRRYDLQRIQPELADMLRGLAEGKAEDDKLWPGGWWRRSNEMLQEDLDGVDAVTQEGYLQFHSLRHSFNTTILRSVSDLTLAMQICRLSSVELVKRYYHADENDVVNAIRSLPLPTLPRPTSE